MPKRKATYQINSERVAIGGASGGGSSSANDNNTSLAYNNYSENHRHINEHINQHSSSPTHRPGFIMDQTFFEKLSRKKSACPCAFYGSIAFSILGVTLLVFALVLNESWQFLGIILSAILLIFAVGFSIIFYSFGKQRTEREIKDYEELSKNNENNEF